MAEINSQKQLEAWLEGQPRKVAVAIAARSSLRVLPLLVPVLDSAQHEYAASAPEKIMLPVFRAASLAWGMAALQDRSKIGAAAAYAAARTAALADVRAAYVAFATAAAAEAASDYAAARAADAAAARAAARAADAAARAADAAAYMWQFLSDDIYLLEGGQSVEALMALPLFSPDPVQKSYDFLGAIHAAWEDMRGLLEAHEEENWQVWTDWYGDRLYGRPFNEKLELRRILLEGEHSGIWERSASEINSAIAVLIMAYEKSKPVVQLTGPVQAEVTAEGTLVLKRQTPEDHLAGAALEQMFETLKAYAESFAGQLRSSANVSESARAKFQFYADRLPREFKDFQAVLMNQMFRNALKSLSEDDRASMSQSVQADLETVEAMNRSVCLGFQEFEAAEKHIATATVSTEIPAGFWDDARRLHEDNIAIAVESNEVRTASEFLRNDAEQTPEPEKIYAALSGEYNLWAAAKSYLAVQKMDAGIGARLYLEDLQNLTEAEKEQYQKDPGNRLAMYTALAQPLINIIRRLLGLG